MGGWYRKVQLPLISQVCTKTKMTLFTQFFYDMKIAALCATLDPAFWPP